MPRKTKPPLGRLENLLDLIAGAAQHCRQIEAQFGAHPAPELETLIKLHRSLVLHYANLAQTNPDLLRQIRDLMKPVLDWAALQEKQKQRQLAEQKYHDHLEAAKADQNHQDRGALRPETLEQIERELNLL